MRLVGLLLAAVLLTACTASSAAHPSGTSSSGQDAPSTSTVSAWFNNLGSSAFESVGQTMQPLYAQAVTLSRAISARDATMLGALCDQAESEPPPSVAGDVRLVGEWSTTMQACKVVTPGLVGPTTARIKGALSNLVNQYDRLGYDLGSYLGLVFPGPIVPSSPTT
jgi:hypothetical protein